MVVKWDNLEVQNGLVYRRLDSPKPSIPTMLQLLVPRCCVPEVLRLCHTGTVGGHFGVKRTMIQVQRRFYWATWMQLFTFLVSQLWFGCLVVSEQHVI